MGLGKKLISNTTFLLIDFLAVSVFSYAFWSIIGKFQFLSTADYGIIVTVINTSIILSSVSFFGFSTIVQKLIPEYIQTKRTNLINNLIRFSMKILAVTNLSILIILTAFSNQIAPFLKVEPIHIVLIGILTVATTLANFTNTILQGFQKMMKIAKTDAIGYFIKAGGTFLLLLFIQQNVVPVLVFAASLFVMFFMRMNFSWLKARAGTLDYRSIVSEYAWPTFLAGVAWMLFTNAQYLILTIIQDPATTGVFSVAAIVTTLIATVPNTMSSALFPILSQMSVSATFKKHQEFLISRVLRYSLFIVIPLTVLFSIFPDKIIIIFSRSQFLGAASLFPILSIAALLSGTGMFLLSSLYALRKIKENRNVIILTAAVFLSLSIVLAKMFSSIGLAFGYLASIIFLFAASWYYLRKLVVVRIQYFDIIRNIIAAALWMLSFYFVSPFAANNLLQLIFMLATVPIYFLALLPLRFYNSEDLKVVKYFENNAPRFAKPLASGIVSLIAKFA